MKSCAETKTNTNVAFKNVAKNPTVEKPPYGRLRVLTAPPTSVQDIVTRPPSAMSTERSQLLDSGEKLREPMKLVSPQENLLNSSSSMVRRMHMKSNSSLGRHGNRDHSITQFAVIDDENISALQQVSHFMTIPLPS